MLDLLLVPQVSQALLNFFQSTFFLKYWLILFFQFTESFLLLPHSAGEPVHGLFTLVVEIVCSNISI